MNSRENANLFSRFKEKFGGHSDAILMETTQGVGYSYADAEKQSAQIAHCLTRLGLKPGDRVTVQVEKSPQALFLYLACLRAGLVFQPLNTAYRATELNYFFTDAEPGLVICDSQNEALITPLALQAGVKYILTLNNDGSGTLMEAARPCPTEFITLSRDPDDLAALLYSSGTTGKPKGIMLSHQNLYENAKTLAEIWEFTSRDRLLHALPIFHIHGLFVAIGCVMMSGASMRWLPKFSVTEVLRYLPECSVMMGIPTYYTRLLTSNDFTHDTCKHSRLFISGSAPLLKETFSEFQQRTGHTILERYGMTETGMNTSNPVNGERQAGTVGLPLPGVELRAVDDQGEPVAVDETGNLQVKGANVFKGYWRKPDKTVEDFTADGFFNTGDKGKISAEGYVTIVGRTKDMIISGGLNIYPKEIEEVIDELIQVKESAVIGVPHADFGEAVVAIAVAAVAVREDSPLSEQLVIDAVMQQLAGFKAPKKVFFVDELPRNTMGKVQKHLLRECYVSCF